MKVKLILTLVFVLILFVIEQLSAQTNPINTNTITISGSRFTYDLLRQWIEDFSKENPEAVIQIVPRETPFAEQATLVINAHHLDSAELREGYEYIKLGRYAILPVANEKSVVAKLYSNKPLKEKEFKELYFDPYDETASYSDDPAVANKKPKKEIAQVYTRERIACANTTFARYYGFQPKDIKGKTIAGEDKHLIYAISKDTAGISYSIPGLIYNTDSRTIKKGIVLLKTESLVKASSQKVDLSNLDSLSNYLESHLEVLDFPVSYFHVSLKKDTPPNSIERKFLQYVLTKGQKDLAHFGFLKPEESVRTRSIQIVSL